jgi:leader peptidase (prepilin peptidase) / N-methyltransferase
MEYSIIGVMLAVVGLLLGSFAGASVWRLRARQLVEDKAEGEPVDAKELKKLKKISSRRVKDDRSQCLSCGHQLAWYDLVPLFSWTLLRGRCRYCRTPIGWFEPVIELATAAFFVVSYLAWPVELQGIVPIASFVLWLISGVGLIILFSYDAKWFLLPNRVMFPVIGIAGVSAVLHVVTSPEPLISLLSVLAGCGILSGLYFALYVLSKGAWIGFGDIKLGLALALLLADWKLALLALFLANVIGCIVVLPAMLSRRLTRYSRVPFGPMLIVGALVAGLWGNAIISWYLGISLTVVN